MKTYFIQNDGPSELHDFYDGWLYRKSSGSKLRLIALLQCCYLPPYFWNRRQLLRKLGTKIVQEDYDLDKWEQGMHPISEKEAKTIITKWKQISKTTRTQSLTCCPIEKINEIFDNEMDKIRGLLNSPT